jgi:hypothetical protein
LRPRPSHTTSGLAIASIRVAASLPDPTTPCLENLYAPAWYRDDDAEYLMGQGGYIDQPAGAPPLGDPERFADKGYLFTRTDGATAWTFSSRILSGATFPWNLLPAAATNDDARIGSISGMQVAKLDGSYRMFFVASVSDPGCCTGEHPVSGNQYIASCQVPWSRFQIFSATRGPDGSFVLDNWHRPQSNPALRHAALYYEPSAAEQTDGYKGISALHSALLVPEEGKVYVMCEMFRTTGQTQFWTRTDGRIWEIFDGSAWSDVEDGVLPEWVNAPDDPHTHWPKGNIYAHIISHVAPTSLFPGYKYILLAGARGRTNGFEYALSKGDVTVWEARGVIQGPSPGTCDGTGEDGTALNPHYFERDGQPFIVYASGDRDGDGKHDCDGGPYFGLSLLEATLQLR